MPATPSAEISLQVAANTAAAQLEMFSRKFKQMQKDMANSTKQTAQEAKQAGSTFSNWSGDVLKASVALYAMHAPIKAVQAAASLVREEIENTIRVSEGFKNRQVPYQNKLVNLMQSLPANENKEQVMGELDKMLKKSNVANKELLVDIVESAASSTVGMPYLERAKVAIFAAEQRQDLLKSDPQSLEALAKAMVYNHKAFEDLGSTMEGQMGLLQTGKAASLIQDNQKFYSTIGLVPGQVRSAFGSQYSQAEILAVANAINIASGDTEGATTSTQVFNMIADIITKFTTVPEMRNKTLLEQIDFISSSDPRADRIRGELLAAMEENHGELSPDEEALIAAANMGDPEALRQFKDRPDLTGRARLKFVVMNLFQPAESRNSGEFDAYSILKTLIQGDPNKPGLGEMPIMLDESGKIDSKKTYEESAKLIQERAKFTKESPVFKDLQLEQKVETAREKIAMSSSSLRGQYENVVNTLMDAAGPGSFFSSNWPHTYYRSNLSPFRFQYGWQETDEDVAKFYKQHIALQLRAVIQRGYGELPTKMMPGENRYGWFDRQVMRSPVQIAKEYERQGGRFSPEMASYFGLSEDTQEKMNSLYDLYREIESFEKKAKQNLDSQKQSLDNLNTPNASSSASGSIAEMVESLPSDKSGSAPVVSLDSQSLQAVRQVFESVNVLLGIFGPAMSGDRPISVKDANKPRTEPAKGDWRP